MTATPTLTATAPLPTRSPDPPQPAQPVHHRRWLRLVLIVVPVLIFVAAFVLTVFRTTQAIDLDMDEATYAIASVTLYRTGVTQWNAAPFFIHPPLFFLLESLLFRAMAIGQSPLWDAIMAHPITPGTPFLPPSAPLTSDDVPNAIFAGRYLVAVYVSLLTTLVYLFGKTLWNYRVAFISALLFLVDPFVVRRNHFNMLEPLGTLFGLIALWLCWRARGAVWSRTRRRYMLLCGLALGLALISKEFSVIYVFATLGYAIVFERRLLRDALLAIAVSLSVYSVFPIWTYTTGNFSVWWSSKVYLLFRISGILSGGTHDDSGITRPGVTATESFSSVLGEYWPSYLILVLAGGFVALFFFSYFMRGVRDKTGEFLAACLGAMYAFFVVVFLIGGVINEQFVYFLMPFVMLTIAYGVTRWRALIAEDKGWQPWLTYLGRANGRARVAGLRGWLIAAFLRAAYVLLRPLAWAVQPATWVGGRMIRPAGRLLLVGLAAVMIYDVCAWVGDYVLSEDDSYLQLEVAAAQVWPPGTPVMGRELLDYYLLPKQRVYEPQSMSPDMPADLVHYGIAYVIHSDENDEAGYFVPDGDYWGWVQQAGTLTSVFHGRTWDTLVYHLTYCDASVAQETPSGTCIPVPGEQVGDSISLTPVRADGVVTFLLSSGQQVVLTVPTSLVTGVPYGTQLVAELDPNPSDLSTPESGALGGGDVVPLGSPIRLDLLLEDGSGSLTPLPPELSTQPVQIRLPLPSPGVSSWLREVDLDGYFAGYVRDGDGPLAPDATSVQMSFLPGPPGTLFLPAQFHPAWVTNFDPSVHLWSGPEDQAQDLGVAGPTGTVFPVIGPQVVGRIEVFDPVSQRYGWIDAAGVGPYTPH